VRGGIVAVGEGMIEFAGGPGELWRRSYGGDTLNLATYLTRLGHPVSFLTALGQDEDSDELERFWRQDGIDTGLVLRADQGCPGLYLIRTDDRGERRFAFWRDNSPARRLFELPGIDEALERATEAQLLVLSGITLSLFDGAGRKRLARLADAVRGRGGDVAFDTNYRPAGWAGHDGARAAFDAFAPLVTIALPGLEDEQALRPGLCAEAVVARWHALGAREVALKLGTAGALVLADGATVAVPVEQRVAALDTTGAGDAFGAAYLASRRDGMDPVTSAKRAQRLAAAVVQHAGALIPKAAMPSP